MKTTKACTLTSAVFLALLLAPPLTFAQSGDWLPDNKGNLIAGNGAIVDAPAGNNGLNNIVIGAGAKAFYTNEDDPHVHIAIGAGASAYGDNSTTVVGTYAKANEAGVAIGAQASADESGVAIGYGAKAIWYGVALGSESVAEVPDEVSVGKKSRGQYDWEVTRRITNIKAGVDPTDAVNMSQLASAGAGKSIELTENDLILPDETYVPRYTIPDGVVFVWVDYSHDTKLVLPTITGDSVRRISFFSENAPISLIFPNGRTTGNDGEKAYVVSVGKTATFIGTRFGWLLESMADQIPY